METSRKFTVEELGKFDGKEGRSAYVAYKGKIYDVTDSYLWLDGEHQFERKAGADLTEAMAASPHGDRVVENMKLVGVLV